MAGPTWRRSRRGRPLAQPGVELLAARRGGSRCRGRTRPGSRPPRAAALRAAAGADVAPPLADRLARVGQHRVEQDEVAQRHARGDGQRREPAQRLARRGPRRRARRSPRRRGRRTRAARPPRRRRAGRRRSPRARRPRAAARADARTRPRRRRRGPGRRCSRLHHERSSEASPLDRPLRMGEARPERHGHAARRGTTALRAPASSPPARSSWRSPGSRSLRARSRRSRRARSSRRRWSSAWAGGARRRAVANRGAVHPQPGDRRRRGLRRVARRRARDRDRLGLLPARPRAGRRAGRPRRKGLVRQGLEIVAFRRVRLHEGAVSYLFVVRRKSARGPSDSVRIFDDAGGHLRPALALAPRVADGNAASTRTSTSRRSGISTATASPRSSARSTRTWRARSSSACPS